MKRIFRQLPQTERQSVAEALVESLTVDDLLTDEQISIIDERLDAVENGQAKIVDGEAVFEKLRKTYG